MSIIQEALKKAQSDVKTPEAPRQELKQVKKPEDVRPVIKPVMQKNGKRSVVKKNILIAAAVSVLAVIAIISNRQFLSKPDNVSNSTSAMPAQEVSYRPLAKPDVKTPGTATDRDPLDITAGIRKVAGPNLVLNGIMYVEESPRAIVNNSIVETGDSVSGAKITRINRKSVILEYEDVEITLNLK